MKKILNVIKYIVLIMLILCLIVTIGLNIVNSTILSKDYIINKLEQTNYYDGLYNDVRENFENYIYQSGLDENVLENIITKEEIKHDTEQIINNLYSNEISKIDVSKIESRLQENINNSLKGHNISNATKNNINKFIEQIVKEYKNTIVHTNYEEEINSVLTKIIKYSGNINVIMIIIDIILAVILVILCLKNPLRGIANMGIAILAVGLFYAILNIFINLNIKVDCITIISTGFSITVRSILRDVMNKILMNGVICTILGIILILLANIIICKKEEKK